MQHTPFRFLTILSAVLLFTTMALAKPYQQPPTFTVIIDAGHGGADNGATTNEKLEKNITLAIAQKVKAFNNNSNINILLSRDDDKTISPKERVEFAKANNAVLYISIHTTAENKSGFTIYTPQPTNQFYTESKRIASSLTAVLKPEYAVTVYDKAIPAWVLKANNCPAILIETGNSIADKEATFFAENILKTIQQYFEQQPAEDDLPKQATATISVDRTNTLFIGIDNPVTVVATNVKPENLLLKPSNCSVKGSDGKYNVTVTSPGKATINLFNKQTGELIKTFEYDVKRVPAPVDGKVVLGTEVPVKMQDEEDRVVFYKSEIEPEYIDGDAAWKEYLMKYLDPTMPKKDGWAKGTYTVNIRFIVIKDGSIAEVATENYLGTYTAQHCIDLVKKGPKFKPARQNGIFVKFIKRQPITFVVE